MLFARRAPLPLVRRLCNALWPRRGFVRPIRYLWARIVRLPVSTRNAAFGIAIGVFVATLPIPGIQLALALLLASLLRANLAAAALGTFWANPLTMPLMWFASYHAGCVMLGMTASSAGELDSELGGLVAIVRRAPLEAFDAVTGRLLPILKPLLAGAVPFALLIGLASYYISLNAITAVRERRAG